MEKLVDTENVTVMSTWQKQVAFSSEVKNVVNILFGGELILIISRVNFYQKLKFNGKRKCSDWKKWSAAYNNFKV